jgi:hypothetical protein
MSDVYLLCDSNSVWGVFSDKDMLFGMYSNLRRANTTLNLKVQKLRMNSNIVIEEWTDDDDIVKAHHPCGGDTTKDNVQIPSELKLEFTKLKNRLAEFKSNIQVFRTMIDEGVLSLDSNVDEVPLLLRDRFHIFCDIIKFNIPDEDAFGYFVDRFYYKPSPVFD